MQAEYCVLDDIFLLTKSCELTSNLAQNECISMGFWKTFNDQIREQHLLQGFNFEKFAVTTRVQGKLRYACGLIPKGSYPAGFDLQRIPRGRYLKFEHQGAMSELKETVRLIFESYLPQHLMHTLPGSLVYFEKYTNRFHFNREDSIIELYVPIPENPSTTFPLIPSKQLLQGRARENTGFSWFGMDYNMNLYKGCSHGCIYCDSRSNCYQIEQFDMVRGKERELIILEQELKHKRYKGVVGIGAMSDTYNPFEKDQQITRGALELLYKYGYGVGIDTKSTLMLRDIDLLQRISKQYPSIVKLTITCADDALGKIIEPFASLSSDRFLALEKLHQAGIYAGILFMPILPFINDTEENVRSIVTKAHQHHAKFIYPAFGLTMRDHQRDYFYYQLDQHFPGLRHKYERLYHNTYSCDSPQAKHLWLVFQKECKRYGIKYRMNDIIKGYKQVPNEQLTFPI